MPKIYSVDLRECVLKALDGGMGKRAAHQAFGVSRSTIDDWIALRAQTGALQPLPRRQGRRRQLQGEVFDEFAQRHFDATLQEMATAWQHEQGVYLTPMSFSTALRAMGWSRKKRAGRIGKETRRRARILKPG